MIGILIITEAGLIIIDKSKKILASKKLTNNVIIKIFKEIEIGKVNSEIIKILLKTRKSGVDQFMIKEKSLKDILERKSFKVDIIPDMESNVIQQNNIDLMIKSGLVKNESESLSKIREIAIELSKSKIKDYSSKLDQHLIQSIQSLDEVDKIINLIESRVKEWYGLFFPELERILDNSEIYLKFILKFWHHEKIIDKELEELGISFEKSRRIINAFEQTKGSDLRNVDLERIIGLSEECLRLHNNRKELAKYVENNMTELAPNICSIAGSTIGARLLAKAGSIERFAKMPASTIQLLGAEKALFRSIRTGSRPPKHGILFQHQIVHTSPRWQRGKLARSLATKLALAARIDVYRGSIDDKLKKSLEKRFEEIRIKYSKPAKMDNEIDYKSIKRKRSNNGKERNKKNKANRNQWK